MTYDAEDRALIASASAGHVMGAIAEALRLGEMEAAVELVGILAMKDPHAADLIVKVIQYQAKPPERVNMQARRPGV